MNTFPDVVFICTLFSCFVVMCNHFFKNNSQKKRIVIDKDYKNSRDVTSQTPTQNVPYTDFMFDIEPVNSSSINSAIQSNDKHVKYILTILVPEKHGEHKIKAIKDHARWGICDCKFRQVIIVDQHDTRHDKHNLSVLEDNGNTMVSLFDFIIKYSTLWPIHPCGNGDGCRFMIVNGKFLLMGISLYNLNFDHQYKDRMAEEFLYYLKQTFNAETR